MLPFTFMACECRSVSEAIGDAIECRGSLVRSVATSAPTKFLELNNSPSATVAAEPLYPRWRISSQAIFPTVSWALEVESLHEVGYDSESTSPPVPFYRRTLRNSAIEDNVRDVSFLREIARGYSVGVLWFVRPQHRLAR